MISDALIRIIASDESRIDPVAIDQLRQTAALEGIDEIVGLPDLHAGRGIAVGAAFWSRSHVYPHLVGSDIGCGMALWETETAVRKFRLDAADRKLHGLEEAWEGDHAARLAGAGLPASPMGEALGSIGGGNHFAELLRIDTVLDSHAFEALGLDAANVLLMIHSGSRGLGHAILERQLARQNVQALAAGDEACTAYLAEHDQAIGWAVLNREIIAGRFFDKLGMKGRRLLDICHNSVTPHRGGWLHRKGAAPADRGPIVIPGSRGDLTYLVQPRPDLADGALQSLAHGAGRKWGRSEARDKLKRRFTIAELERTELGSRVICEDRALIYEEAPQAYKDIHQVIADLHQAGLIDIVATLRPLITYKTRRTSARSSFTSHRARVPKNASGSSLNWRRRSRVKPPLMALPASRSNRSPARAAQRYFASSVAAVKRSRRRERARSAGSAPASSARRTSARTGSLQ